MQGSICNIQFNRKKFQIPNEAKRIDNYYLIFTFIILYYEKVIGLGVDYFYIDATSYQGGFDNYKNGQFNFDR